MEGIALSAILSKITTVVSGGWRISFDIPESENESVMKLSELRTAVLQIGIVPSPSCAPEEVEWDD